MNRVWPVVLVFAILVAGRGVSEATFVLDAEQVVQAHPAVRDGSPTAAFSGHWWEGAPGVEPTLYRPVTTAWFALLARFDGDPDDAAAFHRGTLLLHALCALARYLLLLMLLRGMARRHVIAFGVSLAAGLHAVSFESVACIVGAAEILTATFMALSWCAVLGAPRAEGLRGPCLAVIAAILWLLALLAKESALLLPLVLLLHVGRDLGARDTRRPAIVGAVAFVAAAAAWWAARAAALGTWAFSFPGGPYREFSAVERITSALAVLGSRYLPALFAPFGLEPNLTHQDVAPPDGWGDPRVLLGIVAAGVVILLSLLALRRRREAAGLLAFAIATYLPVSNLIAGIGTIGGYRLLYSPLFGVMAAWLVAALGRPAPPLIVRRVATVAFVGCAVAGVAGTPTMIAAWRDPGALYGHALDVNEKNVWALAGWIASRHTTGRAATDPTTFAADFDRYDEVFAELETMPGSDRLDADTRLVCHRLGMQRAGAEGFLATTAADPARALDRIQRGISAARHAEDHGWGDTRLVFDARLAALRLRLVGLELETATGRTEDRTASIEAIEREIATLDELIDRDVPTDRAVAHHFEAARFANMIGRAAALDARLARGRALDPEHPELASLDAARRFAAGRRREALDIMEGVLATDRAGIEEYHAAARIAEALGRTALRDRWIRRALAMRPTNAAEQEILESLRSALAGRRK